VVALSTAFFLLASSAGLSDPGLEYDELLFVNGALGAPHAYHDFIYREAFGVPTMLMPYIGALKAWLYAPIFSVFGVSVDTIRLPAVLLGAVALLLAVVLIYRLLGVWAAVVVGVLLATDPVYSAIARTDWGPIVLSALLRMTALLCYFALLRRKSLRYLWLLVLTLSLGLFNKLDYVWFIVALAVAAVIVHHSELLEILRRRRAAALAPLVVFIGVLILAFVTLIVPAEELPLTGSQASLGGRITEVEHLFRITLDGSGIYQNMTGSILDHPTLMGSLSPFVLIVSALVGAWHLIWGRRQRTGDRLREATAATTFFLVLFAVVAVGIVLTRQATGFWHIMLLWPLPAVLVVCLLTIATRVPIPRARVTAVAVVCVALLALLVTQLRATVTYVDAYRSNRQWGSYWSTEIYAATRVVGRAAPHVDTVISADWGLGTELFALGNKALRDRFADEWPSFTGPTATPVQLEQLLFKGRRVIVVYHSLSAQVMPASTERVEAILKGFGLHVRPIFSGRQIEAQEVTP
jgi:4-amino-4-deoxy-L-arabinose transferase-like glycosyltransferase